MKKYILIIAAMTLVLASCKKSYLDINQNPNDPTDASITADLILPNVQTPMAALVGATGSSYRALNHWMGQWVRGGDFGANGEEETYRIQTTFGQGLWNTIYNMMQDNAIMERKATAAGQNFYIGAAKVMKVEGFRQLVDMFNNVPYTQAFSLEQFIQPGYDKGEDIYKDLFNQLDLALVAFNADVSGQSPRTEVADVMFFGNVVKWKQYINTLRLKLILRLSETSGIINVADQMAKITNDGYVPFGQPVQVQPGYLLTAGKLNPFWARYKADENNIESDRFNRANPYTLDTLRNNNDPRFMFYFSKAVTPLNGIEYRSGGAYGAPVATISSNQQSNVAGPGLAKSPTQPQWILTSVESLFLQAEARARGYITSGPSAQALFADGVRASFAFLNVPNPTAEANTLLNSGQRLYTYPTTGSLTGQINIIIAQKYFSLVGMAPLEIYSDYRRTGFPNVPLSVTPGRAANIPVRFPYPQSEYSFNAANASAQGNIDALTTNVFWDK